jgi:hypothetical protein
MSAESELADVIRKLGEKLDAMSGVSSSTRTASLDKKEMANLTDRIKKLAAAAKDDADASKALQKIMEDQRRAIMSQSKSRADKEQEWLDLQEKINKSSRKLDDDTKNQIQSKAKEAKAASDHAEATQKVTEKTKQWQEKFDTFGKSLAPAGAAIGSLVSAYQSGGSEIQTAGKLMSAEVQLASSGLQQVGAGATGLGTSMMAAGGKTGKFGAITAVAGTALSMFASGANALAQKVIPVLTTELDKALNGFRSLSTSGALFADGVVGMKEAGKAAGLDLTEFSNVVKNNSSDLAASGLGVTEGSKRIGNVFKSGGKVFQDGLFKLGYTAEEQAGLVAETMGQMKRLGAQPTDKEVAAQTQKYAENLRVIANVTGEDAKTKLKQINEQNQIAAFQAEVSRKSPEQQQQINAAMSTMNDVERKNFRERVMFGQVVNKEGAVYEAQIGGAREKAEKMYDLFQKNALTYDAAADVTSEFVNQIAENGKNAQALNRAAAMGVEGAQGSATAMLQNTQLQQQYGDRAKVQESKDKAAQAAKDAAEAEQRRKEGKPPKENDITGQMLDAAQSARAFKIAMQDEFLKENTLGKFASALNDANAAALKLVRDWGGTVTGANATFMDALSNLGGTALEVISGLGAVADIFSLFRKGPHLGGPHGGSGGGPHPPGSGGSGGGGRMSRMWESSTKFLKDGFGKITGVFTGGAAKMAAGFSSIVGAITTKGGAMAEGIAKAAGAAVEGIKSFRSGIVSGAEKAFTFIESGASSIATKLGSIAEGTASAFKTGIGLIGSNLESAGTFIKTGATTLGNTIVAAAKDGASFIGNGLGKAAGFIESTASSIGTKLATAAETGASMLGTGLSKAAGFVESSTSAIGSGLANTAETLKNGASALGDNISKLAKSSANALESAFGATSNALKTGADIVANKFGTIAESVSSVSSGLANVAKESAGRLGTVLSDATSILKTGAGTIGTKLVEAAESSAGFLKSSVLTIGSSLSGATDFLSNAVKAGTTNLTSSLASFTEGAMSSLKSVTGSLSSALSDAGSFLSNGASKVGSAFESAGSFIKSSASTVLEKVTSVGASAAKLAGRATGAAGAASAGASTAAKVGSGALKVAGFGAKTVLKQLPLLGFGMGLWDAAERISKGDYAGAAMAASAGAATFLPGYGTAASMALTGALALSDAAGATGGDYSPATPLENAQPPVEGKPAEPAIDPNTPVQATPVEPTVNATIPQVNNTVEQNTNDLNTANAAREAEKAVEQAKAIAANAELTKAMIPDSNKPDLTEMLTAQVKQMVALLEELNDNTRSVSTNTRNTYHAVI